MVLGFRSELFQAVASEQVTPQAAAGEFAGNAFSFGMLGQGKTAIAYSYGLIDDQQFTEGVGVAGIFQLAGAGTARVFHAMGGVPAGESFTVTLRDLGPRVVAWADRNGIILPRTLEPGTGGGMGATQTGMQLRCNAAGRMIGPPAYGFNPDLPGAAMRSFEVGEGGLLLPAGRAHGAVPTGSFLSAKPIISQAYVRGPLATIPDWNPATHISDAFVPSGVRLQMSITNPHPSLPGSGYAAQFQVLLDADKARIIFLNTKPLSP